MNRVPRRLFVVCLGLAVPGLALAAQLYILDSTKHFSPISGNSTATARTVGADGDYQGVWGLELFEKSDFPCQATVKSRHLNTSSEKFDSEALNGCSSPGDKKVARFAEKNTYVRGIQICQRGGSGGHSTFVKGVRLFGAKLNKASGALTQVTGHKEIKRANCKEWKPAKYCPAGEIASRIVFYYTLNNVGPSFFVGAKLECRKPKKK